ncbi:MAG: hypothetical protein WDO16_03510 [Bacteroidota bacterium]
MKKRVKVSTPAPMSMVLSEELTADNISSKKTHEKQTERATERPMVTANRRMEMAWLHLNLPMN